MVNTANRPKPKVAIFGGSFDPPHRGHQTIVQKSVKGLNVDKIIVLPAYLNPFKSSSLASPKQRLAWCHKLFGNISNVIVSDYEINKNRSVKTSQSVKYFNIEFDVKYLIIGSDNLSTITSWHEFDFLNNNIEWVIFTRNGYPIDTEKLKKFKVIQLNEDANSTDIRDKKALIYIDNKIENSVKQIIKG